MDEKDRRRLMIVVLAAIILIIILVIIHLTRQDGEKESECQDDADCVAAGFGVCHAGKCVECNFDSDCCGSDICYCHKCQTSDEVTCNPPVFEFACFSRDDGGDTSTGITLDDLDLKPFVTEGDTPIDWASFTITNIEVHTLQPTFGGFQNWRCFDDGEGPLVPGAPFGTHEFAPFDTPFDFCGPGTEDSPDSFFFEGCEQEDGGDDLEPNDRNVRVTWSHDNNGVLTADYEYLEDAVSMTCNFYWHVEFEVSDSCGTYQHECYLTMVRQL